MKDKLFQLGIFLFISLVSAFVILDTINFIFLAIALIILGLSIFNLKVSIFTLLLSRDLVFNSIYYYTGLASSPLAVTFYTLVLIFLLVLLLLREKVTFSLDAFNLTLIGFIFYLAASTIFISSHRNYGLEKLFFFGIIIVGCIFILMFVQKKADIKFFIEASFFQGLMLLIVSLISGLSYRLLNGQFLLNRFTILGINPIWIGRLLFYGALSNIYFMHKTKSWFLKALFITLASFQIYYAFITGSRAPVLAFILGLFMYAVFYWRIKLSKIMLLGAVLVFILFFSYKGIISDTSSRFTGGGSGKSSSQNRILAQYQAFTLFQENYVVGTGFGSFRQFPLKYPHNVFSEITSETGVIGLSFILVLFGLTLFRIIKIYKYHNNKETAFLIAVVVASFFNANLSGHIGFNPYFWLSIFLVNQYYLCDNSSQTDGNELGVVEQNNKEENSNG